MKRLMSILLLVLMLSAPVCFAHGGSLDSNGGHWDRSTGTYHYHSGIHTEGSSSGSSSVSYSNGTYYRTTANVNMRSSASGSSTILQTIPEGSRAMYMGSRNGNWIKLSYNGKTGWCHANYLVKIPKATVTAKPTMRPTVRPTATVNPAKKSVKSSRKELLPMTFGTIFGIFTAGLAVGLIILAVYAHKVHEREFKMAEDARKREANALERGKQDVISKHNADIEMRRNLQMQMIKTLNVLKSLETPSVPDISKGVVYASSDLLAGGLYHHAPICSRGTHMVLISKVVADQLSLTPCPTCSKYPMPESDPTVYITENNLFASLNKTVIYHKANCYCIQGRRVPIKLSSIDQKRHSPCSHCCPPLFWNKPTVWF